MQGGMAEALSRSRAGSRLWMEWNCFTPWLEARCDGKMPAEAGRNAKVSSGFYSSVHTRLESQVQQENTC